LPRPSGRPACETSASIRFPRRLAAGFLAGACAALCGCKSAQEYSYSHLPSGYHWRAVYDPNTNAVVFYGQDPLTLETIYVGPDSRFFSYRHPGPIGPKDLTMRWNPHDAR
jgi:hypothetical protein